MAISSPVRCTFSPPFRLIPTAPPASNRRTTQAIRRAAAFCAGLFVLPLTAAAATKGIWITHGEIDALPTNTAAYTRVYNAATTTWPKAELVNRDNLWASYALAGALVWARTGDGGLRAKVRDSLMAAIRTQPIRAGVIQDLNELSSRAIAGAVVAADLIDLESFAPQSHATLSAYLDSLRWLPMAVYNATFGSTYIRQHECSGNSGSFGSALIAIDRYIGDQADLARRYAFFKSYADQRFFPGNVWFSIGANGGDYFMKGYMGSEPPERWLWEPTWVCGDSSNWTVISPLCTKTDAQGDTLTIDGAVIQEAGRLTPGGPSAPFAVPLSAAGKMYMWTWLNYAWLQAEMLYRAGYTDVYSSGGQALRRSMNFMLRAGAATPQYASMNWIPWLYNYRYATNFPTQPCSGASWGMYWTDWTHASSVADTVPPAGTTSLTSP